jgi:hypothetical protein
VGGEWKEKEKPDLGHECIECKDGNWVEIINTYDHNCVECENTGWVSDNYEWVEKENPYEHKCIECADEAWVEKSKPHDCVECKNSSWFSWVGFGSWEWVEDPPTKCHECEGGDWVWSCPEIFPECGKRTGCDDANEKCIYKRDDEMCPKGPCHSDYFECCECDLIVIPENLVAHNGTLIDGGGGFILHKPSRISFDCVWQHKISECPGTINWYFGCGETSVDRIVGVGGMMDFPITIKVSKLKEMCYKSTDEPDECCER